MQLPPSLEVIIPAYDDGTHLGPLLRELNDQSALHGANLSVLVSDDGSPAPLQDLYPSADYPDLSLRFVRNNNAGPGAARNRGLFDSEAIWVVFLDADTVPDPDWLTLLRSLVADADQVDVIEGRTRFAGGHPSPFAHATEISAGEAFGGANLVYRRDALERIGGFDEAFYDKKRRLHFREDADVHFRAVSAGLRIMARPDLVINHPPLEASLSTPVKLARRYYFDPLLYRKHPQEFRAMSAARPLGPISFRSARHVAAVSHVGSALSCLILLLTRAPRPVRALGVAWLGGSWAANIGALAWKRAVKPRHVIPLLIVSFTTPWVYCWNYYRGVVTFKSRPKFR